MNLHQICLDEASLAVYRIGLDGRFLEANKMAADKGVTLERFEEIGRMIRENGSLKFTSEFSKKDGTVFLVEITTSIIEYKGNEFAVSFVDDIYPLTWKNTYGFSRPCRQCNIVNNRPESFTLIYEGL